MSDKFYCKQCRSFHGSDMFDIAGNCFIAWDWYDIHINDECFESEKAWEDFARTAIFNEPLPLIKVVHGCGCVDYQQSNIVLEWCYNCQRRISDERDRI